MFPAAFDDFLHTLQKLENDFKLVVGQLKNTAVIPKTCEFHSWDAVLQSLTTELHKTASALFSQPAEDSFKALENVVEMRDSLLAQLLMSLIHRKIVLWMDLGILETGYVKGEILNLVTKIVAFRDEHGYTPVKVDYVHPKKPSELPDIHATAPAKFDLAGVVTTFTEEFLTMVALVENNFKLTTVRLT